jgi:Domain of unknown function (DUF4375)
MAEVQGYWSLVEPVWISLNRSWDDGPEAFLRLFHATPREIGHLYAAHWCQSEVCNGGLHQFFSNTTGLLAPEALEGFRAIGMTEWADILAEAMKFFGSPYPRERAYRNKLLASRSRRPFSDLDERFYKWSDRWDEAADSYAERFRLA